MGAITSYPLTAPLLATDTFVFDRSGDTKSGVLGAMAPFSALALVADRLPYGNGSGTMALATFTAAGRALLDDADAAAQRTTLGLGALSTVTPGTGVATALAVNVGSAGAPVLYNGAAGTPSGLVLTNATGLPLTTGVTGILPAANGGTANGFTAFTGPASSTKTFTLPNASDTIACLGQAQTFSAMQTFTYSIIGSGASGAAQVNDRSTGATDAWIWYASGGTLKMFQQNGLADRVTISTNGLSAAGSLKPSSYTVGTVPSASTHGAGAIIYVSNESGGATTAFSDATNWRRHSDRAVIS